MFLQLNTLHALNLDCIFENSTGWLDLEFYRCKIEGVSITTQYQVIEIVAGTHKKFKNDSSVEEFTPQHSLNTINYFPRDLDKHFPNIKKIYMAEVELKEIHQSDLKPFVHLELLSLNGNQLEYLEVDLLKFNLKIKAFTAKNNKILYIDSQVFDHLSKLTHLQLTGNICDLRSVKGNREDVLNLIEEVKVKCSDFLIKIMEMRRIFSNETWRMNNETRNHVKMELESYKRHLSDISKQTIEVEEQTKYKDMKRKLSDAVWMKNVSIFIGFPLFALFTIFNVFLIFICIRSNLKIQVMSKDDRWVNFLSWFYLIFVTFFAFRHLTQTADDEECVHALAE